MECNNTKNTYKNDKHPNTLKTNNIGSSTKNPALQAPSSPPPRINPATPPLAATPLQKRTLTTRTELEPAKASAIHQLTEEPEDKGCIAFVLKEVRKKKGRDTMVFEVVESSKKYPDASINTSSESTQCLFKIFREFPWGFVTASHRIEIKNSHYTIHTIFIPLKIEDNPVAQKIKNLVEDLFKKEGADFLFTQVYSNKEGVLRFPLLSVSDKRDPQRIMSLEHSSNSFTYNPSLNEILEEASNDLDPYYEEGTACLKIFKSILEKNEKDWPLIEENLFSLKKVIGFLKEIFFPSDSVPLPCLFNALTLSLALEIQLESLCAWKTSLQNLLTIIEAPQEEVASLLSSIPKYRHKNYQASKIQHLLKTYKEPFEKLLKFADNIFIELQSFKIQLVPYFNKNQGIANPHSTTLNATEEHANESDDAPSVGTTITIDSEGNPFEESSSPSQVNPNKTPPNTSDYTVLSANQRVAFLEWLRENDLNILFNLRAFYDHKSPFTYMETKELLGELYECMKEASEYLGDPQIHSIAEDIYNRTSKSVRVNEERIKNKRLSYLHAVALRAILTCFGLFPNNWTPKHDHEKHAFGLYNFLKLFST